MRAVFAKPVLSRSQALPPLSFFRMCGGVRVVQAGVHPDALDYVNAHATSTSIGDKVSHGIDFLCRGYLCAVALLIIITTMMDDFVGRGLRTSTSRDAAG